jgi:ribosomal-protein-alanine N-acetyltransferase
VTTTAPERRTARLVLRGWRPADRAPFAAMNADPEVMAHFPQALDRVETDAFMDRIEAAWAGGLSLWALEEAATGELLGFTGLAVPRFEAHFTPAVEVGWRLRRSAWGQGYATEAATEALRYGFATRGLIEIVSFTSVTNLPSQAVMRRIGMSHDPADDFEHPLVPAGHPLRPHVLYRIDAARWRAAAAG